MRHEPQANLNSHRRPHGHRGNDEWRGDGQSARNRLEGLAQHVQLCRNIGELGRLEEGELVSRVPQLLLQNTNLACSVQASEKERMEGGKGGAGITDTTTFIVRIHSLMLVHAATS